MNMKGIKILFGIWGIWAVVFCSYHWLCMQIPENIYLNQDEVQEVLIAENGNIDPEQISLNFSGTVDYYQNGKNSYEGICKLFGILNLKTVDINVVEKGMVIPGGIPIGIYIETEGVLVIGTGKLQTIHGQTMEPAKNIVKTGDYIIGINGEKIEEKNEIIEEMKDNQGEDVILDIRRNQEEFQVAITPAETKEGYQMGIWIRDDSQGIGTLTYVTEDQTFAALGHGVSDVDSHLLLEVSNGKLYEAEILELVKGKQGTPGEIVGSIYYHNKELYGTIEANDQGGIQGRANEHLMEQLETEAVEIGWKQQVKAGKASILSSVGGSLKEYEIEITHVNRYETDIHKGMKIKVTDPELLELTGGIIQGMSGSPILQDGKIVGAVTHVLVNDPTRGYGIFIENMLEAAE